MSGKYFLKPGDLRGENLRVSAYLSAHKSAFDIKRLAYVQHCHATPRDAMIRMLKVNT